MKHWLDDSVTAFQIYGIYVWHKDAHKAAIRSRYYDFSGIVLFKVYELNKIITSHPK